MPVFAPVYRPSKGLETYLARQQKADLRKRRRGTATSVDNEDSDAADEPAPGREPSQFLSTFHPVNKTDPYHVAGHPRETPLPAHPFPHAAAPTFRPWKAPLDHTLAGLNPPLYILRRHETRKAEEKNTTSLRRRHLDNLTAILHRSLLRGDYTRAERAWSILLRCEVGGVGVDVRRAGRWGIGAELLMRRRDPQDQQRDAENADDQAHERRGRDPSFSAAGFALAKQYYERLILQNPHMPRTQHLFNAAVVYPALFNVGIYQAQYLSRQAMQAIDATHPAASKNRRKRAKTKLESQIHGSEASSPTSSNTDNSEEDEHASSDKLPSSSKEIAEIRTREVQEAQAIARRMDELLLGPPYDADSELLVLRAMVEEWLAGLYERLGTNDDDDATESNSRMDGSGNDDERQRLRERAEESRGRAAEMWERLEGRGIELPEQRREGKKKLWGSGAIR